MHSLICRVQGQTGTETLSVVSLCLHICICVYIYLDTYTKGGLRVQLSTQSASPILHTHKNITRLRLRQENLKPQVSLGNLKKITSKKDGMGL